MTAGLGATAGARSVMGTELSYLADTDSGYVRSFRARVVALPPGGVVLDRTYFYPVGGGQPADRGLLRPSAGEPVPVVDVAKSGDSVVHRLGRRSSGAAALAVGAEVAAEIDWDRRYRHMRLHTAQHLLSARIFSRTGRRTARARLDASTATLELEGPLLPEGEDAGSLAADLAAFLAPARPVRIRHLPRSEFDQDPGARSGLVPLPAHVDPVRVVEIDGADRCPCGGTHLRSTGEVGSFTILPIDRESTAGSRVRLTLGEGVPPTPAE